MKKEEQEKEILELRKFELEREHKNLMGMFFKILGILGAIIIFLNLLGIIDKSNFFIFGIIFFLIFMNFLYFVSLKDCYISDCYEDLYQAIKDNNTIDFKFIPFKWYNVWYYKRRFKKL